MSDNPLEPNLNENPMEWFKKNRCSEYIVEESFQNSNRGF